MFQLYQDIAQNLHRVSMGQDISLDKPQGMKAIRLFKVVE
jgi:hypothetical protein